MLRPPTIAGGQQRAMKVEGTMAADRAPLGLQILQRSFPASSGSQQSETVDCLPNYFGYCWIAYASRSSLVISIIPSPTSKHEAELGLCQVIDSPHDAPSPISCVRWAQSCSGLLGASGEQTIWIYKPQFSGSNSEYTFPDFPRGWVLGHKLEHSSKVWSFGWTDSGDGLLSVGAKVIMWKQDELGWHCLWTSSVAHPQAFSAATWSANGLAATAEGNFKLAAQTAACNKTGINGKAIVWWWEDALGLFECELVHPHEIVFLQWRPSKGPSTMKEDFRPVLLTACSDGVVRLWLEIDSGRARLDKASGKDVPAKHLKPAYFVSAVIEAEQCLGGNLGVDAFVSWPLWGRQVKSNTVSACGSAAIRKRQNSGLCEWLVGLGPRGTIILWSVFCLDDIYPPRCPRVFLWKKASGVLPIFDLPPKKEKRPITWKIVSHRIGGRCTDPPVSLDLFHISDAAEFQWTRIWPPIRALCGHCLNKSEMPHLAMQEMEAAKAEKDVWGKVTESFSLMGHADDIIDISVHPASLVELVATLDNQGHIFVWCSSFFLKRSTSLLDSIWRSSCALVVSSDSNMLTWLPAVFSEGQTVLLVARTGFVDCYLISETEKASYYGRSLAIKFLSSLNLTLHSHEEFLAIHALPRDTNNGDFVIFGLGKASSKLILCNIQIQEDHISHTNQGDPMKVEVNLGVKIISINFFGAFELFTSVAFARVNFLPLLQARSNSLMYEPLGPSRVYDMATGSRDGMLKLWKRDSQCVAESSEFVEEDGWECIGFLKISAGPVTMVAIGSSCFRLATWCPASSNTHGEEILIWSIGEVSGRATIHLNGRLSLSGSPIYFNWQDLGNGGSFLGVLVQSQLRVYCESRLFDKRPDQIAPVKTKEKHTLIQGSWSLLASETLLSGASLFSWGPKGSLLVPFEEHLLVCDLCLFPNMVVQLGNQVDLKVLMPTQGDEPWSLVRVGVSISSPLPLYHPVAMLYHLYTGNHQRARASLQYLQQNLSRLTVQFERKLPCSLLQNYSSSQMLEIFLKDSNQEKHQSKTEETSVRWSTGNVGNFDDYLTSFSRMNLAEDDPNKAAGYNFESLEMLNLEKLESLLSKSQDALGLTEDQKLQVLHIADVLIRMDSESQALENACLDHPGQRFWFAVQLAYSSQSKILGKSACPEDLCLDSKAMAWALQSECKDSLLDLFLGSEISWPAMRALGVGFWLTDMSSLRSRMEKLARAQFAAEKKPRQCALLYLALQRKNVLMGLFKLSKDEKDRSLYEFLSRDFTVEKNQAAALKNAYVLLGKHQHDLAAAFFLLGGDLSSAASACAKNLRDLQLALVICRLVEGSNGPIAQRLIKDQALRKAQNDGDYWLASLFQILLGEHTKVINEMTEATFESFCKNGEPTSELTFLDSAREASVDPEEGIFCLHVVTKPNLQPGQSSAVMASVRKWLCLRTAGSLEQRGLPLEALEYLESCIERFWTTLQADQGSVLKTAMNHLSTFKNKLALQFQAHVSMVHPCWLVGLPTSLNDSNQTQNFMSASDASQKLLQSLDLLEHRFAVDPQYVASEVSRLAYSRNMWYLQCVFTRVSYGSNKAQKLLALPCSAFVKHSVKHVGHELCKVIDFQILMHHQPYLSAELFGQKHWPDNNSTERLLLAIDLCLLLGQNGDIAEKRTDVEVFALLLCSLFAWKNSDWSFIDCVIELIMSLGSTDSRVLLNLDAACMLLLRVMTPETKAETRFSLDQLTEVEVWHVLCLAFWSMFLDWSKQHLEDNAATDEGANMCSTQSDLQRHAFGSDLLRMLESITSIFQRKLAIYINTSKKSAHLCNWLMSNGVPGEAAVNKCLKRLSVASSTGERKASDVQLFGDKPSHVPSSSEDCLVDEMWKKLLVPRYIRSAVELGGANLIDSLAWSAGHDEASSSVIQDKDKPLGHVTANGSGANVSNSTFDAEACTVHYEAGGELFRSSGDLLEAICVNLCCPDQVAIASSKKGLLFFDINTGKGFSSTESSLWSRAEWPHNGWANSDSSPLPTFVSQGVGMQSKEGPNLGLGGASAGAGMLSNVSKESSFKGVGVGIPGYGGMGALGLGWQEWEDYEGIVDPLATVQNVNTQAMDSHPLRPLFLVGSRNTHVYLWEFGQSSATATYGILPAANVSPPYALASIRSVKFDHSGHRFATAAADGTISTWQLEVGGRSNVRPTDSCLCFDRHASDVAYVGGSGGIIVATGAAQNNCNLAFWDTLAPLPTSRAFVNCHEGGARCLEMFDQNVGGGSISSLIVTCGKGGDVSVHDFRYIANGKTKRMKSTRRNHSSILDDQHSRRQQDGDLNVDGAVWHISKAHADSITCVSAVPGSPLFFTGSKDGDMKLWDMSKCELVNHWRRVHEKHMFLQSHTRGLGAGLQQETRGFGGIFQAAVTDIKPVSLGILTCGGDGTLRFFRKCKADCI